MVLVSNGVQKHFNIFNVRLFLYETIVTIVHNSLCFVPGSDMLSLGLPPLHVAPFFLYKVSVCHEFVQGSCYLHLSDPPCASFSFISLYDTGN